MLYPNSIRDSDSVPVLCWLYSCSQKDSKIPFFSGGITLDEQARINNFFFNFIAKGSDIHPSQWDLPLAHCRTIFVADRYRAEFLKLKDCPEEPEQVEKFVLYQGWKKLDEYTSLSLNGQVEIRPIDVDLEAITLLN